MEYEQIKQLIEDMGKSKLSSLDIEFPNGIKIKMKKNHEEKIPERHDKIEHLIDVKNEEEKQPKKEEGKIVTSPMVGTFYTKPSPDSDSYVEVGSTVKKGDVLCIIEAMKLMNEIESEYDGKIAEIIAKDGEPVQYGDPLFRII